MDDDIQPEDAAAAGVVDESGSRGLKIIVQKDIARSMGTRAGSNRATRDAALSYRHLPQRR